MSAPDAPESRPPDTSTVHALAVELAELSATLAGPLQRLSARSGDCEVTVEWAAPAPTVVAVAPTTVPVAAAVPEAAGPPAAEAAPLGVAVRAPLVGTYFAAPAPDADPFVQVGDTVEAGQTVAIVEAMKMMNAVVADEPGTVLEVLVGNGEPVEFDQPLLRLAPPEVAA